MAVGEPVPLPQGDDEAARSADAGLPASTFDTVRRGFAPDQVAEYRALMLARVERATRAIWPAVVRGDLFAVDRYVRLADRQAKLLGLDAPTRIAAIDDSGWGRSPDSPTIVSTTAAAPLKPSPTAPPLTTLAALS